MPSPSTSTPPCSMWVSCTRSITVWRRPSRFETIEPFAALTPSVESIVPLWSWSIPRPPAGSVSVGNPGRLTVNVLAGPPPCPTTLIAIVAMPARASDAATAHGAPFIESREAVAEDRDGPASGRRGPGRDEQCEDEVLDPLHGGDAGAGADRRERLRCVLVVRRRERSVGDRADRAREVRRQEEDAGRLSVEVVSGLPICRLSGSGASAGVREDSARSAGRRALKDAGAGGARGSASRIFSEIAVMVCVVKRLAAAMSSDVHADGERPSRASISALRYAFGRRDPSSGRS